MAEDVDARAQAPGRPEAIEFEDQIWALMPSAGEVIGTPTGTAMHHRLDCMYVRGTDTAALQRIPDPDRMTWRRLIDSAPSTDLEGRAAFARAADLVNGAGQPLTTTCSECVLRPAISVDGREARRWRTLDEALALFDRTTIATAVAAGQSELAQVREAFPLQSWDSLPLERYALGHDDFRGNFCHLIEFLTPNLGSISGGSSRKHIIYRRRSDQGWYFDKQFSDVGQAWAALRQGFQDAFTAAGEGRLADIDDIDVLRSGTLLVGKAVFSYFPDRLLPIYSRDHVRHFIERISGQAASRSLGPFAACARLRELTVEDARFAGWNPLEIGKFLYWWADPRPTRSIMKIAPGHNANQWQDCLRGGYICVGWDDVGDLSAFADEDEFREAFRTAYRDEYNGNQSKITQKATEVWRLTQLQADDLVVANQGISRILGVGTVTSAGYSWRPERPDMRHTVAVDWDTSYAQQLPEPEKAWGVVTVAKVPDRLWQVIRRNRAADHDAEPAEPAATPAPLLPTDPQFPRLAEALRRKGQAVLFGPPGTGKTYTSLRFALWWLAERVDLNVDPLADYGTEGFRTALATLTNHGHLTQLTFHPAYAYEDFIEGFRPVTAEGNTGVQGREDGLRLAMTDGVFTRVCRAAQQDPDHPYLVLIDEINRGDLPKIFGELITLIERDKRGITVTLPQSQRAFQVPPNVVLLGTMNTADRSIRLLDSALRRRFTFLEIMPDPTILDGSLVGQLDLGLLLRGLNQRLLRHLGRERQIGHSFFLSDGEPIDNEAEVAAVVYGEVLPLLQEYAYDDYNLLAALVGDTIIDLPTHHIRELDAAELVEALYTEFQVGTVDG